MIESNDQLASFAPPLISGSIGCVTPLSSAQLEETSPPLRCTRYHQHLRVLGRMGLLFRDFRGSDPLIRPSSCCSIRILCHT
ncbi:MAG: hypothetical protein EZS28_034525 [Streblomastix strix]|uniref:Uncharacterized protein n=1 Tax=Streblomastix strix TaxID=222440 RepID=A0A5J4UGM3_9EUKA|nr:MAG: hypothetical protein EZS28_034525 [Streblomastix strix]